LEVLRVLRACFFALVGMGKKLVVMVADQGVVRHAAYYMIQILNSAWGDRPQQHSVAATTHILAYSRQVIPVVMHFMHPLIMIRALHV
jgi:hypothetical protein